MKGLVEFPLDGGGFVVIEVDEKTPGKVPASSLDDKVVKASRTFGEAIDTIQFIADSIVGKLRDLVWPGSVSPSSVAAVRRRQGDLQVGQHHAR
jgi:hypothetical protein